MNDSFIYSQMERNIWNKKEATSTINWYSYDIAQCKKHYFTRNSNIKGKLRFFSSFKKIA